MSEKQTYNIVPKLRFPEFREERGWEIKRLGEIAIRVTNRNKDNKPLPVLTNSATGGIVCQQDYFDREIVTKDNLINYSIVDVNDFVYNPRISTAAPVGPISRNNLCLGIMSPLYTVFRFTEGCLDYFEQYFKTGCWHQYLKGKANFGARFDRMNITLEDFLNMPIPFPVYAEQQRIAQSLLELDELIKANNEKLEQLKAHKKSLLQKLFPQNGKTVPEYRFPEYVNGNEWEEKKVAEIFTITRGRVLAASLTRVIPDDVYCYPVYSSQTTNNGLMGFYNEALFEDAITWTTDGANAGTVRFRKGKFFCTNVCGVLLNEKGYANEFIAAFLNTKTKQYVSLVGNPKLMNNVMAEISICIPNIPEQKKLAACLYSIDKLIIANSYKIVLLEQEKIGLMQLLFPKS